MLAKKRPDISERLLSASLFNGLSADEIQHCIECSGAEYVEYRKGETIFSEGDSAEKLPVLIDGAVTLGRHTIDGRREITAMFSKAGDIFGYEQLFVDSGTYDIYAKAQADSGILRISSRFLKQTCDKNCGFHSRLIFNMMNIMAQKTLELNEQLEIMSGSSLRQRIFKYLMFHCGPDMTVRLNLSRQELADYLHAARPSVSRELMKMQDEGLIVIDGRTIEIKNKELD